MPAVNTVSRSGFPDGKHGGVKMGRRIGSERISRENGYLYFVGKDGYVWRTPMKANKRGSKKRVGNERIDKKSGYLYYIDDAGYVCEAKMKNA
jgi:hypothetical protein